MQIIYLKNHLTRFFIIYLFDKYGLKSMFLNKNSVNVAKNN